MVLELAARVVRDLYCHFCILAMIVDLVSVFNSVVFIYSLMLYMFVIVRCGLLRGVALVVWFCVHWWWGLVLIVLLCFAMFG